MSISWGKQQRFKFMDGGTLLAWSPPMVSAIYAITYQQDPTNRPKSHTVLFFGQAVDLSQEAPDHSRSVLDTWVSSGGRANELFVFVHPMPGSTNNQRWNVQEQLVSEYGPDCNRY